MTNKQQDDNQKKVIGMPYDFDTPTIARFESRVWNPNDRRILTPKTYGVGWDINVYWLFHPMKYRKKPE